MRAKFVAQQTIAVGQPVLIDGSASNTHYGAVFEDDGTTGYFYGLDFSQKELDFPPKTGHRVKRIS